MPSPGCPPQHIADYPKLANFYYTKQDVDFLRRIVRQAEALLPTEQLATSALFSAYFTTLAEFKVNPDHDNRYARVLFKIGGLRDPGTLFQKFEEIISRVETNYDYDPKDEAISQVGRSIISDLEVQSPEDSAYQPRIRERRNSESSAWDLSSRLQAGPRKRSNSFSDAAKARPDDDNTAESLGVIRHRVPQPAIQAAQSPDTLARSVGTWLASADDSLQEHQVLEFLEDGRSHSFPSAQGSIDLEDSVGTGPMANLSGFDEVDAVGPGVGAFFTREAVMEKKAASFYKHQQTFVSRRQYLLAWNEFAKQQRQDNAGLNIIAERFDKKVLLSAAFDAWRSKMLTRVRVADTEKFFAHLEERATKARDLYLKNIGFSHWTDVAERQIRRTALARRHIIRNKAFNLWRDITVVNELKVRRQVLKKFFRLWKERHHAFATADETAVQRHVGDLVRKLFRAWVHQNWATRASSWCTNGAQRRALYLWIEASHENWQDHQSAEATRRERLLATSLNIWNVGSLSRAASERQAEVCYCNKLRRIVIRKWCHEAGVNPAKLALQSEIALRQLRNAFATWLHRNREEQRAAAIDRSKILKEALVNWRHESRLRRISSRIDGRIVQSAMYRWIASTRSIITARLRKEARLRGVLHVWLAQSQALAQHNLEQSAIAHDTLARKRQGQTLRWWSENLDSGQRAEQSAERFRTLKAYHRLVPQWSTKTQNLKQLQQWSNDAEFYFRASKALKQWKTATESTKREKRKTAYAQVRRTTKLNLAKSAFTTWREQARAAVELQSRAVEVSHNRNIIVGMNVFDLWRGRTEEVKELDLHWHETLARKHLKIWRDCSSAVRALDNEAAMTYQESRESKAVRSWSLTTLQVRAQSNYATELREKNTKRSFRKIFWYWHQRTLQARPLGYVESEELGGTTKADEWSELGEDAPVRPWAKSLVPATLSNHIPGYLSTPSRKAERVSAVAAKYSSTTPRAPLSTPFERQLRAQWSGGQYPSMRRTGRGPGRNGLSIGDFSGVPERSSQKDG